MENNMQVQSLLKEHNKHQNRDTTWNMLENIKIMSLQNRNQEKMGFSLSSSLDLDLKLSLQGTGNAGKRCKGFLHTVPPTAVSDVNTLI